MRRLDRPPIRSASYTLVWLVLAWPLIVHATRAHAQAPPDTVLKLMRLDSALVSWAPRLRVIWPGYEYDAVGLLYVVPDVAKVTVRWPQAAPSGMRPLMGSERAHWIGTEPISWSPGLAIAPAVVQPGMNEAQFFGLAIHEAFHAFEITARRPGRRFGVGENAMVTSRYPVMDLDNEAAFAVEADLLRRAYGAATVAEATALAGEFLSVRERRQSRLDSTLVNYERAAELHEGLAQYALLRGLAVVAELEPRHRAAAAAELSTETRVLESTLQSGASVRRRFYATGSHMALLLDRLLPAWKAQLMRDDLWLDEALERAATPRPLSAATEAQLERRTAEAARAIARLRERRVAQRDSILNRPGMRLVLQPMALPGGRADWCYFDPQNLVQTGTGQTLHLRTLRLCSGGGTVAAFEQGVVEDEDTGEVQTVVDGSRLAITTATGTASLPERGQSLRVEHVTIRADRVEITLPAALLIRGQNRLLIVPLQH